MTNSLGCRICLGFVEVSFGFHSGFFNGVYRSFNTILLSRCIQGFMLELGVWAWDLRLRVSWVWVPKSRHSSGEMDAP